MKKLQILLVLLLFFQISYTQNIKGVVKTIYMDNNKEHSETLAGANVYWAETQTATSTNEEGSFKINKSVQTNLLVASFISYENDTIIVSGTEEEIIFILKEANYIDEIVISKKQNAQFYSSSKTINTQNISLTGLSKLPCCNLSESFENNVSVDVSFADAVSGAKQISMLGLAGIYTQILTENIPSIRGLANSYGLAYIPGPWMSSIQISKGTSSVLNGYESITGQINTELKKPEKSEIFYANLFANHHGRSEINFNTRLKLNDKVSTMILTHGSISHFAHDYNHDSFLDMPLTNQINFINRWKFGSHETVAGQFGVKLLNENRAGGQLEYINNNKDTTGGLYGLGIKTERYETYAKLGFPIKKFVGTSFGSTYSAVYHNQNVFFGKNNYSGTEKSFYTNLVLQTIIKNTNHRINSGFSFLYDNYAEQYNDYTLNREEIVPGVFSEYTYSFLDKFNMILGIRADFHNIYGTFFTPRIHLKYNLDDKTTIRASSGKGYRTANIFAENTALMASSRNFVFVEDLKQEQAWNHGINLTRKFKTWNNQQLTFNIDYYRTDFINQIIVDVDADFHEVRFYNLNGKSYSNSFQTEISTELFEGFDVTVAFRYNDVKVTIDEDLIEKPLSNKFKGLFVLSYATKYDKWVFDVTNQFIGQTRLPNTSDNPVEYQLSTYSPSYYVLHVQITRNFRRIEFYIGGENLTNYTQKQPIIAANEPFGNYFDASVVYAPLIGRTFYGGIRLKFK